MRSSYSLFFGFLVLTSCVAQEEQAAEQPKLYQLLQQDVQDEGIDAAMVHLAREMEKDQDVSAFCHALTHTIGHAAYEREGLDALNENNDLCGSGYFHGVIEKHFENSEDVLLTFKTLCTDRDGRCFHGLGHGLMFATENDLPIAVSHCGELDTKAQQVQCAEGVFMENFNTNDNFHQTKYKDPTDPFYPCNQQEPPYKGVCAFYAVRYYLTLHPDDHTGVIDWCSSIDSDVQDACFKGIGSAMAKFHIHELDIASTVCDGVPAEQKAICYEGIVSYIIVHFASPNEGAKWCKQLDAGLRKNCTALVEQSRNFYVK